MLLSRHPNAGHYHNIKMANRLFENAERLIYLGSTLTNKTVSGENQEETEFG
jgi:hypothetical protein